VKNQLTNIISRWDDILKLKRGKMVLPTFVDFHTSNRCNQFCHGCAYAGTLEGQMMSEEKHYQAVDMFIDLGVRAFDFAGGGEPTMLPYLPALLKHIKDRGANYGLITNGVMLNDELCEELFNSATYVRISLEASNREMYRKYKGIDLWDKVLDRVEYLCQDRDQFDSACEISIKFSVGKSLRGLTHYIDGLKLGEDLDVDRITFKALRHEPEELTVKEAGLENGLLEELLSRDEYTRSKVSSWIVPWMNAPTCWLNPLHTVMDHLGNIYICCFYYHRDREKHCLGNIFEQSFKEIWFSEKHWEKINDIKREECRQVDCKFFHHHKAVYQALERGAVNFL
jgi:MoaA/NifB/PqqE/SkfB family radical SAM enzyme